MKKIIISISIFQFLVSGIYSKSKDIIKCDSSAVKIGEIADYCFYYWEPESYLFNPSLTYTTANPPETKSYFFHYFDDETYTFNIDTFNIIMDSSRIISSIKTNPYECYIKDETLNYITLRVSTVAAGLESEVTVSPEKATLPDSVTIPVEGITTIDEIIKFYNMFIDPTWLGLEDVTLSGNCPKDTGNTVITIIVMDKQKLISFEYKIDGSFEPIKVLKKVSDYINSTLGKIVDFEIGIDLEAKLKFEGGLECCSLKHEPAIYVDMGASGSADISLKGSAGIDDLLKGLYGLGFLSKYIANASLFAKVGVSLELGGNVTANTCLDADICIFFTPTAYIEGGIEMDVLSDLIFSGSAYLRPEISIDDIKYCLIAGVGSPKFCYKVDAIMKYSILSGDEKKVTIHLLDKTCL